ncbi:MAG: hypothetical protein LBC71_01805 [Oscillospiraceae bacterium]|jgi:hypothetical protein|nr:hypothetical protein [Oscillospiraceae bacterium]
MIKLIYYEMTKVLSNKFYIGLIVALLLITAVDVVRPWEGLTIRDQIQRNEIVDALYRANTLDDDDLNNLIYELKTLHWHHPQYDPTAPNDLPVLEPPPQYDYNAPGIFSKTIMGDSFLMYKLDSLIRQHNETLEVRANIVNTAKRFGALAVQNNDNFNIRMNATIIQLYSNNIDRNLLPTENFDTHYFSYQTHSVFIVIVVSVLFSTIFSNEYAIKLVTIQNTTKRGFNHTVLAKFIAGALMAFFIALLFSLLVLFAVTARYGLWGWLANVSLIKSMMISHLDINILSYMILDIIFKTLGAVFLAIICVTISFFTKNNLRSYALSTLILLIFYASSIFLNTNPTLLSSLFNVIYWFDSQFWFYRYQAVNILSFPVEWVAVYITFWILVSFILVAICVYFKERVKPKAM